MFMHTYNNESRYTTGGGTGTAAIWGWAQVHAAHVYSSELEINTDHPEIVAISRDRSAIVLRYSGMSRWANGSGKCLVYTRFDARLFADDRVRKRTIVCMHMSIEGLHVLHMNSPQDRAAQSVAITRLQASANGTPHDNGYEV